LAQGPAAGGEQMEPVKVAASMLALILLSTGPLTMDDAQTLQALQPVNHLLFARWCDAMAHTVQPLSTPCACTLPTLTAVLHCMRCRWDAKLRLVIWRTITTPLLHFLWLARALFLPVAAGFGTALAMNDSDTAVDIVLCAIRSRSPCTAIAVAAARATLDPIASVRLAMPYRAPLWSSNSIAIAFVFEVALCC
jgi:hypothetical protein